MSKQKLKKEFVIISLIPDEEDESSFEIFTEIALAREPDKVLNVVKRLRALADALMKSMAVELMVSVKQLEEMLEALPAPEFEELEPDGTLPTTATPNQRYDA
jgi:hypothetical protein